MDTDFLTDKRKNKKYTQQFVAEAVGISRQFYNYIENGHRRPSPEVAQRIAAVLKFNWTKFYSENANISETKEDKHVSNGN